MPKRVLASAAIVLTIGFPAQAGSSDNHARIDPEDITVQSPIAVDDALITCQQNEPAKITHRFVVKDGLAQSYDPFSRDGVEFCFNETEACKAGWHDGDVVYLRDFQKGSRSIIRLVLESSKMHILQDLKTLGPVRNTFDCTIKPLPKPRPQRKLPKPDTPC
ncbi:MAG: hypothetical protein AAF687_03825 [Pseudomonadota bacterium]